MPRTSKNKFEIINDEIYISKEGWPLIGLTTYREDYYEELTSKTWTLTKANSETDDKGYLSNKTLGLLHRYIVAKWYGRAGYLHCRQRVRFQNQVTIHSDILQFSEAAHHCRFQYRY